MDPVNTDGKPRGYLFAVLLGWVWIALLMLKGIGHFPTVHGDEAWMGMFASRIQARGLYTIHEMNTYTGAFYGWILARVFDAFSMSPQTLRLPGVLINLCVIFTMTAHWWRRFGPGAAVAWVYLAATSAMVSVHSRIAWDVCALQPAALAVMAISAASFMDSPRGSFLAAAAFCLGNTVGVHNHFIFLSVPLSFLIAAAVAVLRYGDKERIPLLRLATMNFAASVLVFIVKPRLGDAAFQRAPECWVAFFLAVPVAAALLSVWPRGLDGAFRRFSLHRWFDSPMFAKASRWILATGLAGFAVFHVAPLIQIGSGVVIYKRMMSWSTPLWLGVVLHGWAAVLIAAYVWTAYDGLKPKRYAALTPYERLILLWPLAFAAVFILFRHTTAIRYYILPHWLLLFALAWVLPRVEKFLSRGTIAAAGAAALAAGGIWLGEMTNPRERPPVHFKLGFRTQSSRDFLRRDALYETVENAKICVLIQKESMIDIPLFFRLASQRLPCDHSREIATFYCRDCTKPPYVRWRIEQKKTP